MISTSNRDQFKIYPKQMARLSNGDTFDKQKGKNILIHFCRLDLASTKHPNCLPTEND